MSVQWRGRLLAFCWSILVARLFGQYALRSDNGLRSVRLLLLIMAPLRWQGWLQKRWQHWAERASLTCLERSLALLVTRWDEAYLIIGAAVPGPGGHARCWLNGSWHVGGAMKPWLVFMGYRSVIRLLPQSSSQA